MKFLDGPKAEVAIRKALSKATRARVAVAYWGADATKRLALKGLAERDVIVVCDLMSDSCNPTEIKHLRDVLGEDRVLTRERLHAKVWLNLDTDGGSFWTGALISLAFWPPWA